MMDLAILATLIALGYFFGRMAESRHYQSIHERERHLLYLPTTSSKHPIGAIGPITQVKLVKGNVVISVDYFKRFLATLRNIFGGSIQAYETLLDRARREAILRLKESCADANQIINLRLETSSISKGDSERIGSVEVLAYGTAIYHHPPSQDSTPQ
ncbi:MAG: YbjQ family protein [Nitrospirales bacterium]|nr:YbjQ family protein [Nitrospira sp.]MDR4502154.1 YbjQ family protein [Nitrospirales bacterium]